ncbi:hypothetical protein MMC19_003466 [Ptychographa xylographoides]|nr:hypothetical protein [Ptychographa xylographoides]
MSVSMPTLRPLSCWMYLMRESRTPRSGLRCLSTSSYRQPLPPPPRLPPGVSPSAIITPPKKIKTYPPPPSARAKCPEPLVTLAAAQIAILDPRGTRTRLFSRTNPDAAKVGDILLVRFKSGDPFAGVCMNIRRRGVDTSVLLRNQLTRMGTEMWVKVYSPTVVGIEVVQRAEKRARRARLYYMRKPKHDRGNLQGIVDAYIRTRSLIGKGNVGSSKGRGANADKKTAKKK